MKFDFGFVSDVGTTRESNQDSVCFHSADTIIGEVVLAAVCDGMGGLSNGEYASNSMTKELERWFQEELPHIILEGLEKNKLRRSLEKVLVDHNDALIALGEEQGKPMGTTVSAILILEGRYFGIHVGDSRIYRLYRWQIMQITNDHSRVMQQVRMGIITKKQAEMDSRKNELTQCIGVRGEIKPEFIEGNISRDTTFVLCSDGFVHKISDREIWKTLRPNKIKKSDVLNLKLKKLVEENKKRMETDNITVLAIRVTD